MSETNLEIRINLVRETEGKPPSKVKAYASVSFELPGIGKYAVNHIRIVDSKNGLFVSNPAQEKEMDGKKKYWDHHHPCTKEGREAWSELIMAKFEEELGKV